MLRAWRQTFPQTFFQKSILNLYYETSLLILEIESSTPKEKGKTPPLLIFQR